jgi:hypothetical protein
MRYEISVLVFIAGLVLAGWSLVRTHRADLVLAENERGCAIDREVADVLRTMPASELANTTLLPASQRLY